MDIVEAIKTRKSIRNFKPDPVPKETLREILEIASRAPSAMNTQPWEFIVLSGDVLENIRRGNVEKLNSGALPNPEHSVVGWPSDSVYRQRQVELAKQLFQLMDIQREDKKKRAEWMERGFRYFDAPAAIIALSDRSLSEAGPLMDVGAVMQNICLAALNYGLGTCIEDQGVMYPDVVRKFADISESKRIIIAIAIGYPNWDFPANRVESNREPLESITTWCGFE
ncbi:MAG: nitroreductase [Desulfobacteria bacterium]